MFRLNSTRNRFRFFQAFSVITLSVIGAGQAFALPSFARQTGESCDSCHVGSFGPQLTPHGMKFKIGGYTDWDEKSGHIPLAAMIIETTTHTQKAQSPAPENFGKENNNTVMQELSGFLGGRLYNNVGAFAQATYSGVDDITTLDNVDLRYATEASVFGQSGVFGVSLNNNPSIQDPFNNLPAWRFPFTSSDAAPGVEAAPLIDDGVAGTVGGASIYTQLANGVYAELGDYQSMPQGALKKVNVTSDHQITGMAPYWRLAYSKDMRSQSYAFGTFGMSADLRDFGASGPSDKVTDIGIDGHYQFLGTRKHIFSVNGSFIRESSTLDFSAAGEKVTLNQTNVTGAYYFDKSYGITARMFSTTGSESAVDSNGMMLQADWTPFGKESSWAAPFANVRVGLQYTMYNKLNGDSSTASDSNTLTGFVWASL